MKGKSKNFVTIAVTLRVEMSDDCLEAFGIHRMTLGDFHLNQTKFEHKCIGAMFKNNKRKLIDADVKSAYFGGQTFNEMRHVKAQKAQKQFAKEVE